MPHYENWITDDRREEPVSETTTTVYLKKVPEVIDHQITRKLELIFSDQIQYVSSDNEHDIWEVSGLVSGSELTQLKEIKYFDFSE